MKNEEKPQNMKSKNLTRSLSLLVIVIWAVFIVYYAIHFAHSLQANSDTARNLGWGYLAGSIAPLVVMAITTLGRTKRWGLVVRSAFYLSIYYWLAALFSVTLPFVVDVQTSLLYYLIPYALGALVTVCIYVLAKRSVPTVHWIAPAVFVVTIVAMLISFA